MALGCSPLWFDGWLIIYLCVAGDTAYFHLLMHTISASSPAKPPAVPLQRTTLPSRQPSSSPAVPETADRPLPATQRIVCEVAPLGPSHHLCSLGF